MKNFIKTFVTDTSGAAAAEYVLILAIIGTAIAVGVTTLGTAIGDAMDRAGAEIDTYNFDGP